MYLGKSNHHTHTVIREILVVKKFSYSSKITKIKHMKYFQRTYYIIECELNYHRVQKIFNTNISHTNIFNTKIFQNTVASKPELKSQNGRVG